MRELDDKQHCQFAEQQTLGVFEVPDDLKRASRGQALRHVLRRDLAQTQDAG